MVTKAVIQSAKNKNRKAQKALYEATAPYIYTIVKNYIWDDSFRKDAMQVVYAQVFLSLDRFDEDKGTFKAWIAQLTINQCIKFLKKHFKIHFNYGLESLVEIRDDSFAHLDTFSVKDIEQMLKEMPKGYRTVFLLSVIDGFSHKEIAAQLNISVETSRTQLMRSKKWIKQNIAFPTNNTEEYGAL